MGPCHHAAPGGTSQDPARVSFQGILSARSSWPSFSPALPSPPPALAATSSSCADRLTTQASSQPPFNLWGQPSALVLSLTPFSFYTTRVSPQTL